MKTSKTASGWMEKFGIGDPLSFEFISALALVKKACAFANRDCGVITSEQADMIAGACDEIILGAHRDQFPVSFIQSGSGTISNMNMNEVISSLSKNSLHPNDIVNRSQSSNDIIPTTMQVAAVIAVNKKVLPEVFDLAKTFKQKGEEYWEIIKAGRTHLMDAVPIRLGMEFDVWGQRITDGTETIKQSLNNLSILPIGGTAVGSGINAAVGFDEKAAKYISEFTQHQIGAGFTGFKFKVAKNKAVAISSHDSLVEASSALNNLAVGLISITTNIRWLSSGPRTGINELELPATEAGSSIMPGKVNPSIPEGAQMICYKIMGNHQAIMLANMHSSDLDMNTAKPLMIETFLESANLLADCCKLLNDKCIKEIKPNHKVIQKHLENTLMTVTALTPLIGYDKATEIALKALRESMTLREAALALGVSEKDFDLLVDPKKMV
jgi:fumarate hydratase class II